MSTLTVKEREAKQIEKGKKLVQKLMSSNWQGRDKGNIELNKIETKKTDLPDWIKLSEVLLLNPSNLITNELNQELFKQENKQYFEELTEDIKIRGIIVPIIAKTDGTILAGHNRLKIAVNLKFDKVPVQKVLNKLTPKQEKDFVIKDNLFRRQLSDTDRKTLYKSLSQEERKIFIREKYSEKEIKKENRGGDQKSKKSKTGQPVFDPKTNNKSLAKLISKELGGSEFTAKEDLTKIRKDIKAEQKKEFISNVAKLTKENKATINKLEKELKTINQSIEKFENDLTVKIKYLTKKFYADKNSITKKTKESIKPKKDQKRRIEARIKKIRLLN